MGAPTGDHTHFEALKQHVGQGAQHLLLLFTVAVAQHLLLLFIEEQTLEIDLQTY